MSVREKAIYSFPIGPVKAYKYIEKYKTIESTLEAIEKENESRKKKFVVPENFLFKESREFFKDPDVIKGEEIKLKWEKADEEQLTKFLQEDKGFSETTVVNALKKLKAKGKANQKRLDSFFKVQTKQSTSKEVSKTKSSKKK